MVRRLSIFLMVLFLIVLVSACSSSDNAATESKASEEQTSNEAGAPNEEKKAKQDRINIATNPVGSAFNALGNGLVSVISTNSDVQASVQPHAGVNAFAPLVGKGDVSIGVGNGPEFVWAFRGENDFKEPLKDLRLVVRGNYISASGAVVRQDSGIKTVAELKGKKVTSDFPGSYIGKAIMEATLVANGVTWDDVTKVPTPTITAGIESLQDNRVEAAFALVPSSPVIQEAHNAVGLHALHFLDNYSPDQINEVPKR
ncbi:TAXI family TRAP transporter solute-binding subunit [Bacillus sp. Marseille-P3661]|uniref:TAXI family TRAP transporter solute-binding subunit n=1 Tax=Bacillus sp. Marseille-P3661 TaxID=1936234 RepID=UPI000C8406E4|nr:TAXI family TRAP transporter solute-binding subunit [Bacillus sp. Marseille-P3661]